MSRIVFLVAGDPDQFTGGYIYDARIARALEQAGHAIQTVGLAGRFPTADDTAARAMAAALDAAPDDAHIVIDGLALGTLGNVVAAHRGDRRITALVHHPLADEAGLDPETARALYQAEKQALAAVDDIIVTSRFTERRLRDGYLAPDRPVTVVEPGVVPVAPPPRRRRAPPRRLLCIATLIPRKGHDVLIAALARLAAHDWQCDWFGDATRDPAHATRLDRLIDEAGLSERIHRHGAQPPAILAAAYREADLFVLASAYEGFGMVITEAISHGLPVVTTTGGALVDTLPEGAGIGVAPDNSAALAGAIERCLLDPGHYNALADGALDAAGRLNDWARAGQDFAAALARDTAVGVA